MTLTEEHLSFLAQSGWSDATAAPVSGDASSRSYTRLTNNVGHTAILMDASAEPTQSTQRFVAVAKRLADHDISAPEILHADLDAGFLLLEDFGDGLIADHLRDGTLSEGTVYRDLAALLPSLWQIEDQEAKRLDATEMIAQAGLFVDWYVAHDPNAARVAAPDFFDHLCEVLQQHIPDNLGFAHRDFHVENILWLPTREGLQRYGLIDFQDAVLAPRTYDLASLLTDARRDIDPALADAVLAEFLSAHPTDQQALSLEFSLCAALRNLRILGIFARLSLTSGKPRYIDFVPRVWRQVDRALGHQDLSALQTRFRKLCPPPDATTIAALSSPEVPA